MKSNQIYQIIVFILFMQICAFAKLSIPIENNGNVKITDIQPNVAVQSQGTKLIVKGEGFDENSTVIISPMVSDTSKFISNIDTDGSAMGVTVENSIAYVADGYGGLVLIDVSNPSKPVELSRIDTNVYATNVTVVDSIAYVAGSSEGLNLIDVSNPSNPTKISNIDTNDYTKNVTVENSIAYVADGIAGLALIDVSNPSKPVELSRIDTDIYIYNSIMDVTIENSIAYVVDGDGLTLINISNSSNPIKISNIDTDNYLTSVIVKGSIAYCAGGEGLTLIDISDPSNPTEISNVATAGFGRSITVIGSIAYIANSESGITLIDISNPFKPTQISNIDTADSAMGVTVKDSIAYVADLDGGFSIIDISSFSNPTEISFIDINGRVTIVDSIAYVTNFESGVTLINVSDPYKPTKTSYIDTNGFARSVTVVGSIAYVPNGYGGLTIIDASDPYKPTKISNIDSFVENVTVVDSIAYVAKGDEGLTIIDVSDPSKPIELSNIDTNDYAVNVTVINSIAYVSDSGAGLTIIDVSDPSKPIELSNIDTADAGKVFIENSLVYINEIGKGLSVIENPIYYQPKVTYIDSQTLEVEFPNYSVLGKYSLRVTNDNDNWAKAHGVLTLISQQERQTLVPTDLVLRTEDGDNGLVNIDLNDTTVIRLNGLLEYNNESVTNVFTELNTSEYSVSTSNRDKAYFFNNKLIFKDTGRVTITLSVKGLSDSITFNITDSSKTTTFQDSYKDAIIILGHLDDKGGELNTDNPYDPLRYSINKSGNLIYKTLSKFGIGKDNIHYFNPNGEQKLVDHDNDKVKDNAVDHVNFTWDDVLTTINSLDATSPDPLILWMVDHGLNESIHISEKVKVTATQIKEALDSFQEKTGRPVIAIFDACYSGSIAEVVKGSNRMVISSADSSSVTYMNQYNGINFSYYLLKYLMQGYSVKDAFDAADEYYNQQLASNGLSTNPTFSNTTSLQKKLYKILGKTSTCFTEEYRISDFEIGNGAPVFSDYIGADGNTTTNNFELKTKTDIPYLSLAKVSAIITPPNSVVDVNTSKMMKNELVSLSLDTENYFKSEYDFNETGTYTISYMVEDDDGNIFLSDTLSLQNNSGEYNITKLTTEPSVDTSIYEKCEVESTVTSISLSSGWNLISLPVDTTLSYNQLSSKLSNASTVWKYSGGWKAYGKGTNQTTLSNAGISQITSIAKDQGFWVNSSSSDTLEVSGSSYDITTSSSLTSASLGWHLLGTGLTTSVTDISTANSGIKTIWAYNNGWSAYSPNSLTQTLLTNAGISPLSSLSAGQGFWVNVE